MTTSEPVPKNLREQMVKRLETMPEADLVMLHELMLLGEKLRLRQEMSDQAEGERAAGLWADLPEIVRSYRAARKSA